jgi:hypothetical protein
MWYTRSEVMRKLMLHFAHTFCAGRDRAANDGGKSDADTTAAAAAAGLVAADRRLGGGARVTRSSAAAVEKFAAKGYAAAARVE